jgi:hypothetical protein
MTSPASPLPELSPAVLSLDMPPIRRRLRMLGQRVAGALRRRRKPGTTA